MPSLGTNIRCVAPKSSRDAIRSFYGGAFGCECMTPMDDVDIFLFEGGFGLAVYLMPEDVPLSPTQHRDVGTWIEIRVDDVEATKTKILASGGTSFEYHDKEHNYFQAPGGQTFRLAPTSS